MSKLKLRLAACVLAGVYALATPAFAVGAGNASGLSSVAGPRADPAEAFAEGKAALAAGDPETATQRFSEVLEVAPQHPEANYYNGLALIGLGDLTAASGFFETAIENRADYVDAREQLALLRLRLDDAEAAQAQLAALREMQQTCAAAKCDDARNTQLATAVERIEAALAGEAPAGEDGSQALFFAPREDGVDAYLAAVRLINEARYDAAITDLFQSQSIIGPHPDILNYLGYAHRKLGEMTKAQNYYAQALAIDPDHLGANEYLGELYLEIGEFDKARAQLARLDALCTFGCAEHEDLARLIDIRTSDRRAAR